MFLLGGANPAPYQQEGEQDETKNTQGENL
jgi:hypothetical protein